MNPFINAIMERNGSMALDAELDYILGEDFFDEGEEEEESEPQQEEQEDFFDEGEGEEEEEESEEDSSRKKEMILKKKMRRKFMKTGFPFSKGGKKARRKKRVKRKFTKRELRVLSRLRKKLLKKKSRLRAGKWVKTNRRHIDAIKRKMQKIRDRARRRYLNKQDKGSKNEILHILNPFAMKENAVIQGMKPEEKKAYLQKKSISSGLLVGIFSTGLYSFYKREESSIHVLEDGSQMTKEQYLDYEENTYSPMRVLETDQMPWKETIMQDPKKSGGIFAGATVLGIMWANYNLKNK